MFYHANHAIKKNTFHNAQLNLGLSEIVSLIGRES